MLQLKTGNNILYNVGISIDQPKKDDTLGFPNRNCNRCIFGNVFTQIAHNTSLAFEISYWTTGYYDNAGDDTDISSLRFQTAFNLNF